MKNLVWLCVIFLAVGCQRQKTPEELFQEKASGVVLITNDYYYEMQLPNKNKIYFTGVDDEGVLENFAFSEEDVKENRKKITGTGFFIDAKGTIMTNRHVAQPQWDKSQAKVAYTELIKNLKTLLGLLMSQMQQQYAELEMKKKVSYSYDMYSGNTYYDWDAISYINQQESELEQKYNEYDEMYDALKEMSDASSLEINTISKIGIVYNDTYVTSDDDFFGQNSCVVVKVSDDEDVDLALIRLKNKSTPSDVYVFNLSEEEKNKSFAEQISGLFGGNDNDEELTINQDLYMIGYNAGLAVGTTKQGIKAQLNSGKLTQLSDGQRLLYSIPAIQGSSGSPVIDAKGNVVGVNFAKLRGTDNFNFGIPLNKIRCFMEK